jgi:hypothetical protein
VAKYRKRPITVEAVQFHQTGDHPAVTLAFKDCETGIILGQSAPFFPPSRAIYAIETLEGWHEVTPGDWIITGINGEHYPCKPDIFNASYDPVEEWVYPRGYGPGDG